MNSYEALVTSPQSKALLKLKKTTQTFLARFDETTRQQLYRLEEIHYCVEQDGSSSHRTFLVVSTDANVV